MWQFDHFISLGKSPRNTPKDIYIYHIFYSLIVSLVR